MIRLADPVPELQRIADNLRYIVEHWDNETPQSIRRLIQDQARDLDRIPALYELEARNIAPTSGEKG
jgi:hypothetical protein